MTDTLPGGSDIQLGLGSIFSNKDQLFKKVKINSGIALGGIALLGAAAVGGVVVAAGALGAGALPIIIGGAILGIGASFFGLYNLGPNPYTPGKAFLEPREIGGKRDLSKEILALGKKNFEDKKQGQPYITGRKEIDMRSGVPNNGFGSIEIDNTLPKGLLTLEVNIDIKDPNGAYMYDTTTSINKSLNKNFLAKYEGEKLKNVWWEVSMLPFTNTCPSIKESKGVKIKDLTDGKQKYFNIDFEDYFTPAMKNGVYNGPVTFYIHLVGEGYGSCKTIFSNTVTVVVNPDTNFVELVNKDAIRPNLTTTGNEPNIKKGGEFTNESDSHFIDWSLGKEKQIVYFHLDKNQKLSQIGRWQVSVVPFKDNECIAPEGLVAQQNIDISINRSFSIPFDIIALNKPKTVESKSGSIKTSPNPGFLVEVAGSIANSIFNYGEDDTAKRIMLSMKNILKEKILLIIM